MDNRTVMEHAHISRGISKLGADIPSVNLPPIVTCRTDAPCFKQCYAHKGRFAFPRNKSLLARNLDLWNSCPDQFERDVKIAAFHHKFFRWHSSGDIPDEKYLHMMVRLANELPNTRFLAFTKKHELINTYIDQYGDLPQNLSIVLSAWGSSFIPENPYGLPLAYVRLKGEDCVIPASALPCSRYCGECVMKGCSCWDLKHGQSVYFDEH